MDSKGRRPIILGGKEERIVLTSLFFTMCESELVLLASRGWERKERYAGREGAENWRRGRSFVEARN